ncbi:MAG: LacI family DNA-binding transcriptional regulator [Pleomorphochaeta sp.]
MTLKELSEKIDISPSTISRVLNDKPGISKKTRDKVLEAVKREGFSPNYLAKNLASSKAKFIGIVARKRFQDQDSFFFSHTLSQFQDIFVSNGFIVIPLYYNDDEIDFTNTPLSPQDFAGFIVRGQSIPSKTIFSIQKYNIPFVLLENNLRQTQVDSVICNDEELEYKLTNLVIEKGIKRVLHITGPASWYNNFERVKGYEKAIEEHSLNSEIYHLDDTTLEEGKKAISLFKLSKKEKIGITFANDVMAIGFIHALRATEYSIPDDICIVGFDDIPWAHLSNPPLTTAKLAVAQMGRLAANRLIELINNKELYNNPITIIVSGDIVIRESC